MATPPLIYIVVGSVRASRLGPRIADWIAQRGRARAPQLALEIVDLADWPLPMDDEPGIPARGHYANPHTQAWSTKIAAADGFVFVTPQYNWGYPASLKNALDHLHAEWRGKPAVICSYGGHGGGKCAAQLAQVFQGLKLRTVSTMPALNLSDEVIRDGAPLDADVAFASHAQVVDQSFEELAKMLAETAESILTRSPK